MADKNVKYKISLEDKFSQGLKKADKGVDSFEKKVVRAGKVIAGVFAGGVFISFASKISREIIKTTSEFEKFEAVLSNTLGSRSAAQDALKEITDFASRTPFQVNELSNAFVKLANQGFKPNIDQLTSLGDLASSTGKSFDQLAEAIIDAQVGEFERLKEFGIRASKQGDKVQFTFKGVKKQVDFTEESIRKYVLSLGKATGVTGAMAKISKTTGGQISNLQDNVDQLKLSLGKRFKTAISGTISGTAKLVKNLTELTKIPVEEKIKDQTKEVKLLIGQLRNVNLKEEERIAIINKLNDISPQLIEGIDAENVSMERLTENLREFNKLQVQRIVLAGLEKKEQKLLSKEAKREIKIEGLLNEGSEGLLQIREDLAVLSETSRIFSNADKTQKEFLTTFDEIIQAVIDGNAEVADQLFKQAKEDNVFTSLGSQQESVRVAIRQIRKINEESGEQVDIAKRIARVRKNLGLDNTGLNNTTLKGAGSEVVTTPSSELKEGIQTIKGSAPKTFNININNLVENFEVNSENITESAVDVREKFIEMWTFMLADAQAVGG